MFANGRGESGIRAEEAATIQRQLETQPRPAQREKQRLTGSKLCDAGDLKKESLPSLKVMNSYFAH